MYFCQLLVANLFPKILPYKPLCSVQCSATPLTFANVSLFIFKILCDISSCRWLSCQHWSIFFINGVFGLFLLLLLLLCRRLYRFIHSFIHSFVSLFCLHLQMIGSVNASECVNERLTDCLHAYYNICIYDFYLFRNTLNACLLINWQKTK